MKTVAEYRASWNLRGSNHRGDSHCDSIFFVAKVLVTVLSPPAGLSGRLFRGAHLPTAVRCLDGSVAHARIVGERHLREVVVIVHMR